MSEADQACSFWCQGCATAEYSNGCPQDSTLDSGSLSSLSPQNYSLPSKSLESFDAKLQPTNSIRAVAARRPLQTLPVLPVVYVPALSNYEARAKATFGHADFSSPSQQNDFNVLQQLPEERKVSWVGPLGAAPRLAALQGASGRFTSDSLAVAPNLGKENGIRLPTASHQPLPDQADHDTQRIMQFRSSADSFVSKLHPTVSWPHNNPGQSSESLLPPQDYAESPWYPRDPATKAFGSPQSWLEAAQIDQHTADSPSDQLEQLMAESTHGYAGSFADSHLQAVLVLNSSGMPSQSPLQTPEAVFMAAQAEIRESSSQPPPGVSLLPNFYLPASADSLPTSLPLPPSLQSDAALGPRLAQQGKHAIRTCTPVIFRDCTDSMMSWQMCMNRIAQAPPIYFPVPGKGPCGSDSASLWEQLCSISFDS